MKVAEGPGARSRILEAANQLFYAEGIRAVGVDTICRHANVTKMTLYHHFASKDELITAYVEERVRKYWTWFEDVVGTASASPLGQLRNLVAGQATKLEDPCHRGCPFLNIRTEVVDADHPARKAVRAHKDEVRARLTTLCEAAGASQPQKLTDQLLLLLHGASMTTRIYCSGSVREPLTDAAELLFQAHLQRPSPRDAGSCNSESPRRDEE